MGWGKNIIFGENIYRKKRVWWANKEKWKANKDYFAVTFLGSFFKSAKGRLSKSMEQYTP